MKSGVIVGLCMQKRGFKVYTAIFGSFINLIKQLTINSDAHFPETLLMQEHTVRVDYHCFKCWHVLTSLLPKRKY